MPALHPRILLRHPWLLACLAGALYLLLGPPGADLPAQLYRAWLFQQQGFSLWDGQWYGGHHVPAYSILAPPLVALLGSGVVALASASASAALFQRIVRGHFGSGRRAMLASAWFACATVVDVVVGRIPFALGVALALGAVLAAQRGRPRVAVPLALLTPLASPVAGVFLALAGTAHAVARRSPGGIAIAALASAPALALAVTFPEGGVQPFALVSFLEALTFGIGSFLLVPREQRLLRAGAGLYTLGICLSFAVGSPMGSNVLRLGMLFGGPLLLVAVRARWALIVLLLGTPALLVWQWGPGVRAMVNASGDPSTQAAYYQPLVDRLGQAGEPTGRLEIPFTLNHWESYYVADRVPLARGWERQLDLRYNKLFYEGHLTAGRYHHWLMRNGVRWVALPDAPLDPSAVQEAHLIRDGLPYLRPVWRGAHWRLYEVRDFQPLLSGPGTLTRLQSESFTLHARHPGTFTMRVRYTRFWALTAGAGCVERGPNGWTRVTVDRPGTTRVTISFSPGRLVEDGPRCRLATPMPADVESAS